MSKFYIQIQEHWDEVISISKSNKLVTLYSDKIEYIE